MSSDSDSSGLAGVCGGRPRGGCPAPASVRWSRSDSHPSWPPAGETGGASARREAGPPRSGGGSVEALPTSRMRTSLRLLVVAAITGDDPVEFGERLDLVDDHLAHLRGVVGGLLRHLEHTAAQLVAGRLELVMHLGGHLLHGLHHRAEL